MLSVLIPPASCELADSIPSEIDLLAEIVDAAAAGDSSRPVLQRILHGMQAHFEALTAQLWIADRGGVLRLDGSAGPEMPVDSPLSPGGRLQRPWIRHDLRQHSPAALAEWVECHGAECAIAVPVSSGRHDFGRIEVLWTHAVGLADAERLAEWGRRMALVLVQDRMHSAEELALGLLQAMPAAAVGFDLADRVTVWNAAARQMFGWNEADIVGRPACLVPAGSRADYERQSAQVRAGRRIADLATLRQRNDGALLEVTSSAVPLFTAQGEVRGMLEVLTDRSRDCRQERQFQALFGVQRILASSPSLDAAAPALLQTLGTLVGCERTELWVRNPSDGPLQRAGVWRANPGDDDTASAGPSTAAPPSLGDLPAMVLRQRSILHCPANAGAVPRPELGAQRPEAAVGVPVFDQQQVVAMLGFFGRDVREFDDGLRQWMQSIAFTVGQFVMRQRRESELAETRSSLRQAQKMDALGLLTGGIAHDFNNVLTVILSYSELAGDEMGADHPAHEMLCEIHNAGQRAAAMTRRLLSFSRRHDERPILININDLVADLERMLRRLIGPGVEWESRLAAGVGPVRADPGQMEQVLVNLVVNARDAMPTGGRVTITTCGLTLHSAELRRYPGARSGDYVAVTVTDTGCGMDESTRARIFEPFFTTKDPGRGTGMGLATVAAIVRQCGGFIDVETAVGHGTSMHVFLPRAREVLATQSVDEPPAPPPGGTETILLVEEDPIIRTLMRRIVQVRGYQVREAADGDEALRLLADAPQLVSLVLTSPEAARMRSTEFAQRMAAVSPGTRVMLLVDCTDDRLAAAPDAIAQVLQKPFTSDDLARKIRVALDEHPG